MTDPKGNLVGLGWPVSSEIFTPAPSRVSVVHGARAEAYAPTAPPKVVTDLRFAGHLPVTPVAGDWVRIHTGEIVEVLPRTTTLSRPARDGRTRQTLAANIDLVMVTTPIDRTLNTRMLQRLAVMAWDSGAQPVVVLTKADGADAIPEALDHARAVVPGVDVYATSTVTGEGLEQVRRLLTPGTTGCFLGASGVGKTSLLNALGAHDEVVAEVRRDGQGRHTTSTRRLHLMPHGGVLIDIPGLRSLDLDTTQDAVDEVFADISDLRPRCRFADCTHAHEPGCAVKDAVDDGSLPPDRLADWHAIQRERQHQLRKEDPMERAKEKAKWRVVSKAIRRQPRDG